MDASIISASEKLIVVVHTEHDQWQAFFTWEKSACLMEVSVTEQILYKFPNS